MNPHSYLRSRNRRRSSPARKKHAALECRLAIECLEDRTLLATGLGLVTGLTDSPAALLTTGFYYDLLGRAPAASEVGSWVSALQSGVTPAQEALAFVSSSEYRANVITEDYWNFLKRGPSSTEVDGWLQTMQAGVDEKQVAAAFLSSPEYYSGQGGDPSRWLSSLYQNVLDRTPSSGELASWNQALQNGVSRTVVALGFVNSTEAHIRDVTFVYEQLLGRNPDAGGLANWVAAMDRGLTPSLMSAYFAASAEYASDQTPTPEVPAAFNTGSDPGMHFKFASGNSPVAAGYTTVPVVNYTPTRGYGWWGIAGIGWRDRNTTNPLTSSFATGSDALFVANLPDGAYTATVSLGDAQELHDNSSIWANGVLLASGLTTVAGQFIHPSYPIQVTGGQLAFRIAAGGGVNSTFAIDALDIAPVPAGSLTLNPALPGATVNNAYSATLRATGGSGMYTFAVTSGSLPSGLALNASTGVLSGTPATAGTSSFTLSATDSEAPGRTGSQTYTLTVDPASSPAGSLTLTTATLPRATVNNAYNATLGATGGSGMYTFQVTSGSLPSWLALDASTGVLSGTPTTADSWTFTITATDSQVSGLSGSQPYTLVVNTADSTPAFPNNVNVPPLPAPTGTVINVSTVSQLQNAVANLQSGQTILITPGTYNLTDTLFVPQGLTNIAIRGATGKASDVVIKGDAVLDTSPPYTGSAIWGAGSGVSGTILFGIWLGNVQGVTIADLTLVDYVDHAIIMNAGVQSPLLHNVVMLDVGEQFVKVNPDGKGGGVNNGVVEYCTMAFTTSAPNNYTNGVDLLTAQNWIIRNNLFKNIYTTNFRSTVGGSNTLTGPAVLVWQGSSNVQTISNTFINCQTEIAYGLISGSTPDNTGGLIANNFIYRSATVPTSDVGISVRNSPNTEVAYNTIIINGGYANAIEYRFTTTTGVQIAYNLTDAAITQRDGATAMVVGNVTNAQLSWFVDASSGNLNLTSAAAGALKNGVYLSEVPTNYNGQPRLSTAPTDVGAD